MVFVLLGSALLYRPGAEQFLVPVGPAVCCCNLCVGLCMWSYNLKTQTTDLLSLCFISLFFFYLSVVFSFIIIIVAYIILAHINRAGGLYGRILTEVVSTDRTQ